MMKRWLISAAAVAGIIVSAGPAAAAPPTTPGTDPVDFTFTSTDCGFDVDIHVVGKTKTINFSDERLIIPAPGQVATVSLTADPDTAVQYVITGTFFVQVLDDDSQEVKVTGRNILIRPGNGIFLTTGDFNYALNADGSELRPFSGSGTVVNICDVLT
jgi:hypothetical protein